MSNPIRSTPPPTDQGASALSMFDMPVSSYIPFPEDLETPASPSLSGRVIWPLPTNEDARQTGGASSSAAPFSNPDSLLDEEWGSFSAADDPSSLAGNPSAQQLAPLSDAPHSQSHVQIPATESDRIDLTLDDAPTFPIDGGASSDISSLPTESLSPQEWAAVFGNPPNRSSRTTPPKSTALKKKFLAWFTQASIGFREESKRQNPFNFGNAYKGLEDAFQKFGLQRPLYEFLPIVDTVLRGYVDSSITNKPQGLSWEDLLRLFKQSYLPPYIKGIASERIKQFLPSNLFSSQVSSSSIVLGNPAAPFWAPRQAPLFPPGPYQQRPSQGFASGSYSVPAGFSHQAESALPLPGFPSSNHSGGSNASLEQAVETFKNQKIDNPLDLRIAYTTLETAIQNDENRSGQTPALKLMRGLSLLVLKNWIDILVTQNDPEKTPWETLISQFEQSGLPNDIIIAALDKINNCRLSPRPTSPNHKRPRPAGGALPTNKQRKTDATALQEALEEFKKKTIDNLTALNDEFAKLKQDFPDDTNPAGKDWAHIKRHVSIVWVLRDCVTHIIDQHKPGVTSWKELKKQFENSELPGETKEFATKLITNKMRKPSRTRK